LAAPSYAFTINRAAEILGEEEELLWDVAMEMEPEDGKLWTHGTGEQETVAFTERGMEICGNSSLNVSVGSYLPPRS
jgi:hypothetical protein